MFTESLTRCLKRGKNVLHASFRSFVYMGDDDGISCIMVFDLFVYMATLTTKEFLKESQSSLVSIVIEYN